MKTAKWCGFLLGCCILSLAPFLRAATGFDALSRTLFYASDNQPVEERVYLAAVFDGEGRPTVVFLASDVKPVAKGWQFCRGMRIEMSTDKQEVSRMLKFDEAFVAFPEAAKTGKTAETLLREEAGVVMFSTRGLSADTNVSWVQWNPKDKTLKYVFAEKTALLSVSEPRVKFDRVLTLTYGAKMAVPVIATADSIEMKLPSRP